jgi:hypothetical protein
MPQGLAREACPFGQSSELCPSNLGMHPASHAAVGPADHILAPNNGRPIGEPAGDELRMLHNIGGMTDHAGHQDRAGRELHLFPDTDLVLVPRIRRLELVSLSLHLERDIDDVLEGICQQSRRQPNSRGTKELPLR